MNKFVALGAVCFVVTLRTACASDCDPAAGAAGYRLAGSGSAVVRLGDGAAVPPDADNKDWACYQAWLAAGNAPQAATPASVAEQLADRTAAGLTVTFTSAPALNGAYSIGAVSKQNLSAIYAGIRGGDGLPGGGSTFYYRDAAGAPHAFTADQFAALAKAVRDYLYQLDLASASPDPSWPASSVTIP